ncbi:DEAD/DEAH box helicase [Clostridium lundense]|uniref:DEAD/DEAH box helicase n=1 Tax=Clostridium lundense TaxID=319475 RepID=UPI0004850562|nr:DEAD/DEAH box helicase [Clostridium lundense]
MNDIKFSDLELHKDVLKAIDDLGFEEPSQIQAEAIPVVLSGKDMIGQAQTGTGKTLAFGAPIISKIKRNTNNISALILTPTRELAIQITDELARLSKYTRTRLLPVYGGQPIDRQIRSLKKGVDIVVGTPGRILDHIDRGSIDLSDVNYLVLDEADEMLNMGFIDDIETIIKSTNEDRQTLLFSATMPGPIKKLASRYMKENPTHIAIIKNTVTVDKIKQFYFEIKNKDRFETLSRILDLDEPSSAIIFCKTKKGVDEVVESMQIRGYNVEGMHGDMAQNHRINTLKKFREGNLDFLVATDVAARGIDVKGVSHVINYDLPQDTESYVHRIGRTGRANTEGIAYSLVTPKEYIVLKGIEKFTKSKIRRKEIPTLDDILESKYKTLVKDIRETIAEGDFNKFIPLATELDEEFNLVDVAAALMKMTFDEKLSYNYTENSISSASHVRLFLTAGRMDKINPKSLLVFLADNANISSSSIGNIDILEKFSFVNVDEDVVDRILKNVNGKKLNGRKVKIEVANSSR